MRKGRKGADTCHTVPIPCLDKQVTGRTKPSKTKVFAKRTAVGISGCLSETESIAEDICFEFFQRETTWGFMAARWAESLEGSKDEQSIAKLMN
jgi:hypothetical protein